MIKFGRPKRRWILVKQNVRVWTGVRMWSSEIGNKVSGLIRRREFLYDKYIKMLVSHQSKDLTNFLTELY